MATLGSLRDACDDLVDPWCDPCFNDGVSRDAVSYCDKCVEFHCENCFESHGRYGATKHHKVVQGSRMPACQADKPVKYNSCDQHEGEAKDHYCFNHYILVCGVCSVRQHNACDVRSVQEACTSFSIATDEQTFSCDIEMLLEYVRNTDKSLQENINTLEKETQNALEEAENTRDKQIQQINRNFENFSRKINKLRNEQTTTLDSCKSAIEQILVDIQVVKNKFKTKTSNCVNYGAKHFIELQTYSESIRLCEEKITRLQLSHISLNYDFNLATQSLSESPSKLKDVSVCTSDFRCDTQRPAIHYPFRKEGEGSQGAGGSCSTGVTLCPVSLTRLGETEVKTAGNWPRGDCGTCLIWGLDITADGHLILIDWKNSKVKLFSVNGQILSSFRLSNKPKDVAVVDKATAAVSMLNYQIVILELGHRGKLSERKNIRLDRCVHGITGYKRNLILACGESVLMINLKGQILWSTDALSELFDCARYLTVQCGSGTDIVIVSDVNKHTITVLEADSGMVKVCDVKGSEPRGVTVDDNGNIYVCYESGEISVWSGNMEEKCLTIHGGLGFEPRAIVYSSRLQQLIVTSYDYDDFIYNYKISS